MPRYKYRLSSYSSIGSGDDAMFAKWDKMILRGLVFLFLINLSATIIVDRFKNDLLTEAQVFKRIPQTFFWNFK